MDYSKAVLGSHILDTITYFRLLLPPTQFNGWHKEKSRNEKVLVYSKKPTENKQMDRATTPIYMASTILDNISPDDLIELIKSPNLWDRDFIETKKLATIDSDTYVTYTALNAKADFATKERDFAVVEHTVINPALSVTSNTYDYISFSIDSALAPIIKDRYREKPTLSAWRVQKVAPSPTSSLRTEVTFVYQCNLKGAVKHSELKNFLTRRVYINISALRHYLEKNHSIPLSVLSSVDRKGSIASSSKSKSISVKSTVSSPASQIPTETTTAIPPRSSPAENSKPAASRASLASTVRASAVPTVIEGKFETSAEPISIGEKIEVVTQETIDYTKLVYPKHENDEASVSALKYMKELLSKEGNWNVHSEQRGVKIMMYEEPGSNGVVVGMPTVRGDTTYSVIGDGDPVDNFFSVIMSRDARKIWDPRFDSTKLVQWINPNEAVYHSYQKGQFPVSGRDLFIHQRIFYEDDDTTFLIQTSVPHTVDHAPTTSHVRAHLYLAGWKIKKISSNKLDIKYVVHIDPKGTIPSRLMKMVSTQTPLCVAGVIDYIHSHGFPMKPLFIGNLPEQNVISSFISDQTTPSGYEFTYNFTLNRKPAYIGEGLVQLNVSDKIFQRGLEVKCDATDILDIVVDRSELNIRFYVKENINFPITSREIKVNISKRTGGGKVFNLNGSTMKFDDKFEPKNSDFKQVSTLGSIANGANTTISEQFKTVKSYSTEKNVVGNAIELKQCYSPSCRDGETEGKCYSAICPNVKLLYT
ncbi:hypothetical protein HK099_006245 [Clydaea vesicula]|uniref:START domain-containing protein n=1 Tax=Clydaea vesicula TaxID=447962 RepID=A0AAD5TXT5_9FUNG|nr:hypothetical protein HK099_006245 [Clydaea vesicula]